MLSVTNRSLKKSRAPVSSRTWTYSKAFVPASEFSFSIFGLPRVTKVGHPRMTKVGHPWMTEYTKTNIRTFF